MKKCTARVFIFSGRPDPAWLINVHQLRQLEEIWIQLKSSLAQTPIGSRLGYRGVSIICVENEEFIADGGYVKKKIDNKVEWRIDEDRYFERFVLSTAPKGLFPADLLE